MNLNLNFHHLRYFSAIAREGSIARAGRRLGISQPALSAQLRELERALGAHLFERVGRGLVLTETGRMAVKYAEDIFRLGDEFLESVQGREVPGTLRFHVGIADSLPKLSTYRLLTPALSAPAPSRITLRIDKPDRLLADLAIHALDLVLLDQPAPPAFKVKTFNHALGDSGVTLFGVDTLARRFRRGFPASLEGAPLLLPGDHTPLRRSIDHWLLAHRLQPRIVAEVEDIGLLQVMGQHGLGVFFAPTVVERAIVRQHGVRTIGRVGTIRQTFYAVTTERQLRHPAALAISAGAFRRPDTPPRRRPAR